MSDHLSEVVENTSDVLAQANCITIIDEMRLQPLNLGLIAAFYSIQYTTIELFNKLISANSKHRVLLTALSAATEWEERLEVRAQTDEIPLKALYNTLNLAEDKDVSFQDPHLKALILLMAHIRRQPLNIDLQKDLADLLIFAERLVQALADVVASNAWLTPLLATMELSQMLTQACSSSQSSLWQLPGVTQNFIDVASSKSAHCSPTCSPVHIYVLGSVLNKWSAEYDVKEARDLSQCEDEQRDSLFRELGWTESSIQKIADACNALPVLEIDVAVPDAESLGTRRWQADGTSVAIQTLVRRDMDDDDEITAVVCPYFPAEKMEHYWLVVGDVAANKVLAVKRTSLEG